MDLTGRQRAILEKLLAECQPPAESQMLADGGWQHFAESEGLVSGCEVTLGSIAGQLGVSTRTVHRDITRLSIPLKRDFNIILSGRPGYGIALSGKAASIAACIEALHQSVPSELDSEDRRRMVALILLTADDVVKILALTCELGVSTSLIRRDLDLLSAWFSQYGLTLVLRKGLGLRLEGSEDGRRQALCSLISDQIGEIGLLALLHDETYCDGCLDEPLGLLLSLVPVQNFHRAETALAGLAKKRLPLLAPRDYLDLVVHLAVALTRNDGACLLKVNSDKQNLPQDVAATGAESETGLLDPYSGALAILAELNGALRPLEAEAAALERFLRGAKLESTEADQLGQSLTAFDEVCALIEVCEQKLANQLSQDRLLRNGLVAHWGPASYRLRNGLPIRNPLLERIRSEYCQVFDAVRSACDEAFPHLRVNDDEVAFLVMHIGSAISRAQASTDYFRALVVCSAGIGSAYMLASRIRTELPEIKIVANLSWFDVQSLPRESWDILVSTIPLPLPEADYVLVDPLLSAEGISAIRQSMIGKRVAGQVRMNHPPRKGSTADLKQLRLHLGSVISILDNLKVFSDLEPNAEWAEFIKQSVARCAESALIAEEDSTLRDLMDRSRDYGIMLPGSKVLFLHTRSAGVKFPSLTVHVFSGLLPRWAEAWSDRPYVLVLLLAPSHIEKETQDILNEISVSLLDEHTIKVLHTAVESDIKTHYSRYLERYFKAISLEGA
ncbi:MAG: transcription antiterminator [Spirochaetes bacterium]|nr:transcription antiterminator [Spirochaetota bacterium]